MECGKFIGGAEKARRRARKVKYKPKQTTKKGKHPGHIQRLPNKISPQDRFFASLLLSSVDDIVSSNEFGVWPRVIGEICGRAGVRIPGKLNQTDHDANDFFSMRASLVLEEARCILSEELLQRNRFNRNSGIEVNLLSMQQSKNGFIQLHVGKKDISYNFRYGGDEIQERGGLTTFTPKELYAMKPGCVIQLFFQNQHDMDINKSIFTSIVPTPAFDDTTVSLMTYRTNDLNAYLAQNSEISFCIVPIGSLISEQRQFVACFKKPKVCFILKLMGGKSAKHTRFNSDDDSVDGSDNEVDSKNNVAATSIMTQDGNGTCESNTTIPVSAIHIPKLNKTQEQAAKSFINGPLQNLCLVQGPPGTGKTTFMTAVLCRTFLTSYEPDQNNLYTIRKNKRVLVAAPTNKAVSILASRFLRATNGYIGLNVVLIGVEDALFPEDESDHYADATTRSLKSIFVYTWVKELIKDLACLKMGSQHSRPQEVEEVLDCARFLQQKIEEGIPQEAEKAGSLQAAKMYIRCLKELAQLTIDNKQRQENIVHTNNALEELLVSLNELDSTGDAVKELLATANIIFSTLTSSGVSLMKRTPKIDELFVDEAAAATEPLLLIPLHLQPTRMLAVGDPKQLPANVTSRRAIDFGLDKSLLDRLMFGCGNEHIMLDVQYRMKPCISSFPRAYFYNGKLQDGDNVSSPKYDGVSLSCTSPYRFIQVDGEERRADGGSYYNMEEARVVLRLVDLIRRKSTESNVCFSGSWSSLERIRIITFYSGQVRAIKGMLKSSGFGQVMVTTVDSSQGCESDIIIVSFVRCNGKSGFLDDDRRINVALTRAKYKLICIGDAENTLSKSGISTLETIVSDAKRRQLLCDASQYFYEGSKI